MCSYQEIKNDKPPFGLWLAMATGAAFGLLLIALFQVVNGQLEQTGIGKAQYNAAQAGGTAMPDARGLAASRFCAWLIHAQALCGTMPAI